MTGNRVFELSLYSNISILLFNITLDIIDVVILISILYQV